MSHVEYPAQPKKLMPNYLRTLDKMASKNWRMRVHPLDKDQFFLEADRLKPTDPYAIQVFGEDRHSKLYPPKVCRADMELAAILRNNLPEILELLEMRDAAKK